jgi:hypothetical protein
MLQPLEPCLDYFTDRDLNKDTYYKGQMELKHPLSAPWGLPKNLAILEKAEFDELGL